LEKGRGSICRTSRWCHYLQKKWGKRGKTTGREQPDSSSTEHVVNELKGSLGVLDLDAYRRRRLVLIKRKKGFFKEDRGTTPGGDVYDLDKTLVSGLVWGNKKQFVLEEEVKCHFSNLSVNLFLERKKGRCQNHTAQVSLGKNI